MALRRLSVIKKHLEAKGFELRSCSLVQDRGAPYFTDKQFRYTLNSNVLSDAQKEFYERNGYLVISGLLQDDLLDSFSCRFVDLCEGRAERGNILLMKDISLKDKGVTGQFLYNKAQDILYDEVLEKYFFSDKILDVVECFTGPNIVAIHSMLINKPPDSGALTSRHPLHQDLHYFPFRPADRIVAAWTALEEVTTDNGCLIVVPGSHKGSLLKHSYPQWEGGVNKAYHGIENSESLEVTPLTMKKGDTVFFHPLLIHGSGPNITQGFRKAISGHFAAGDCDVIDVKGTTQENIAKEVEEMAMKRGFTNDVNFQEIWRLRSRLVRGEGGFQ